MVSTDCLAVHHCHQKNICHLDLKLTNLMLDENKKVRLIDFGCSRKEFSLFEAEITPYSAPN